RLRHEPPEQGVQIGREVMNCSLDQGGQRTQTYEELTQVVEAELLGIVERFDPPPVNDRTFSKPDACQIEAEDANRVKPALAGPTLVKVAEARNQPGQKSGPIGMSQGNHRLAHEGRLWLEQHGMNAEPSLVMLARTRGRNLPRAWNRQALESRPFDRKS